MMIRLRWSGPLVWYFSLLTVISSFAAPPVVSNIRATQRSGTQLVDIYYDVSDADGNSPLSVYMAVSGDGGANYNVPVISVSGALGQGVTLGNNRYILWNAGVDWPGRFSSQCKIKIIADDGTAPAAPANMAYIPAGAFQMGDSLDGNINEMPIHGVYVSAFFCDKYEVRKELWQDVYAWSLGNGYSYNQVGAFSGAGHPVQTINWYDAVKWCNARSEKDGLTPCYYTDSSQTTVLRSSYPNITNACVKWTANGYRLPTEAEWEKAARGAIVGSRFPWGNSITTNEANYFTSGSKPGGSYPANGYGLFDVAGNVFEWIWDSYDSGWYGKAGAIADNCHGPDAAPGSRLLRGGSNGNSNDMRCSKRDSTLAGNYSSGVGFRCVRGLGP